MRGGSPARYVALLSLSLSGGCFTHYESRGAPVAFGEESVALLRKGRTTREDVLRWFGAPSDVSATRSGESYRYVRRKRREEGVDVGVSALFGLLSLSVFRTATEREDLENLTLLFDERGVLELWSFTPLPGEG